ncbi:hypothetical protein KKA23_03340 [Patescibacteria group bacterium]|nr:hypothetical protein [Patescibacteria group bacterium]MBU3922624.1 hypothetical protein [Patescibacteria group bacterium]
MRSNKKTRKEKRRIAQYIIDFIKRDEAKFQADYERNLLESIKKSQIKN